MAISETNAINLAIELDHAERRLKRILATVCRKPIAGRLTVTCHDTNASNEIWPHGGEVTLVVDGINCDANEAEQIAEALEEIAARLRQKGKQ